MAKIADLFVNLAMGTASFGKGTKAAISSLKSLGNAALGLNAVLDIGRKAGSVLAGVFDSFARETEQIDKISKLATRSGFSTEFLSTLGYSADLAGSSLDEVSSAITKMQVNLAKLSQAKNDPLNAIGLSAKQLIDLKPDVAFVRIADAINAVPNPAHRAEAAVKLFGKSGADLLNVLSLGSEGFAKAGEAARAFGLVISTDVGKRVEAANDQIANMGKALQGLKIDLASDAAGIIALSALGVQDILKRLRGLTDEIGITSGPGPFGQLFEGKNPLLDTLASVSEAKKPKPKNLAEELDEVTESAKEQQAVIDHLQQSMRGWQSLIESTMTEEERFEKQQKEFVDAIEGTRQAFRDSQIDYNEYARTRSRLEEGLARVQAHEAKRLEEAGGPDTFGELIKKLREGVKTPTQKLEEELAQIRAHTEGAAGVFPGTGLTAQESQLAQLQASRTFLESLPSQVELGDRPGAIEKGSSAALSASFGQRPVDKVQAEIKRITAQMLEVMKSIDQKTGTNFSIPSA